VTYSPSLNKFMTGAKDDFTIPVDLSAAKGVFAPAGTTKALGKTVTLEVDGLKPNRTYEWYAVIGDCGAKVETQKVRFKTN